MGLTAGVAVAIAVVAVAVSAYLGTRSAVYGQIDTALSNLAMQVTHPPRGGENGGAATSTQPGEQSDRNGEEPGEGQPVRFGGRDCDQGLGINEPGRPFGGPQVFVQLLSPRGNLCRSIGSTTTIPVTTAARGLARSGRGRFFTNKRVNGIHIRVLVQGIGGHGALMLALPLTSADSTLSHELLLMGLIAAGGIALAALLGFLVARAAVAPITRFTRRTERIAGSFEKLDHQRLEVHGADELSRLALSFNSTLDALEGSIEAQRNLVADASHELRTPIATLRANLQLLRDETRLPPEEREALRRDMIEELDELTNLVSDVVELARGAKASEEPGEVRLEEILDGALERARRRGPGLTFEAQIEPALVRGEGERIARAVNNLLDNAIKWAPPGSIVEVGLQGGVLSVRDHGPGFHEEDLPFVFDRFHRAREARSKPGSGLGLAIVRQAAEAHAGFVQASNAPGGGALLRVSFGPVVPVEGAEAQGDAVGRVPNRG
jgi:two-component system sensor histidine kinase MprB